MLSNLEDRLLSENANILERGSVLIETSLSIGILLFVIASASNISSIIWEATIFTEVNRSASRYSTMQTYNQLSCGETSENYKSFVRDGVVSFIDNFQVHNSSTTKVGWESMPFVNLKRVTYPRGYSQDSMDPDDSNNVVFDYSVISVFNKPNLSCKFCSSLVNNVFALSTTSLFMLPCSLEDLKKNRDGNKDDGGKDDGGKQDGGKRDGGKHPS